MAVLLLVLAVTPPVVLIVARWYRAVASPRHATVADLDALFDAGPCRYAHLTRLFGGEDFCFLASSRWGSLRVRRLRAQRAAVMARYLGQVREEFERLAAVGGFFAMAPTARAEGFAWHVTRQRLAFYVSFYRLRLQLRLAWLSPCNPDVRPLAAGMERFRQHSRRLIAQMGPRDVAALRQVMNV